MPEKDNIQDSETSKDKEVVTRNKETFYLMCLLTVIWVLPYITASEAAGLAIFGYWFLGALSIIVALVLFVPMRWLVRLSLDGHNKTPPRIAILVIIAAVIIYMILNITPWYVRDMKYEANKYYTENPQEFSDPFEGKIVRIDVMRGPYDTFYVYTSGDPPERPSGGVIINYKNGWYFSGEFMPD